MSGKDENMNSELTFTPVIGIEIHIQLKTDTYSDRKSVV